MDRKNVTIEESWKNILEEEFKKSYFSKLVAFLKQEKAIGKTIYPLGSEIFKAFELCPFEKVKVVIIGQDPYHGKGQAMGLSFSVPKSIKIPPSLRNVFKEIQDDLGHAIPFHGDLTAWAKQGVFLLNAILTVEANKAASHRNKGWEEFTDATIRAISKHKKDVVFLLWGNYAKNKIPLIDTTKHLVLTAAHPSPLARNAFFNNRHFSQTNDYLEQKNIKPISWNIE